MTGTDDTFNLGPITKTPFNPDLTRERAWQGITTTSPPGPAPRNPKDEAR